MLFRRRESSATERFVETLHREAGRGQFAWSQTLPPEPPRFADLETPLAPRVAAALDDLGIRRLYAHQAAVVDRVRRGENVVLATPTASGKTLAFNLPVLERLLADSEARALHVYPTNALVNDQQRALAELLHGVRPVLTTGVLTGATSIDTRRQYRATPPRILLTNPEMLHLSLAGAHDAWSRYLGGLRFIVLDELHMYRGLFGAHVALSVRRLLRAAALHGAHPQLVGCSATIGNPGELAERLTGLPFSVVEGGGAARGPRTVVIWRPGGGGDGGGDPQADAVWLFCRLVSEGLGTILFALTRRGAEAMLMQARERLGPGLRDRVAPYRNGYTPDERRKVEEDLKNGRLLGVVSTNALEVGIDIGGLDAAVIAGFPGSRSSFWQQAGRAGRGPRGALVVYVPYERVVDAYYAAHPDELLGGRFEDAIVDLANPFVLGAHLACAASERALRPVELPALSPAAAAAAKLAEAAGRLTRTARGWTVSDSPHGKVNLRGDSADSWQILSPSGGIGSIDGAHLHREAFPGAVYLHQGERYRVTDHDVARRIVRVEPEPRRLITEPVLQTAVTVDEVQSDGLVRCGRAELRLGLGALRVDEATTAYRELQPRGRRHERTVVLEAPLTHSLRTTGCWLVFPELLRRRLEAADGRRFATGLHALEHILPSALSLQVLCDPHDVITTYELTHAAFGGPTLFVADARAGGAGITTRAAERLPELLRACHEIVRACPCKDGCPACILSTTCWRQFDPIEKPAALALLAELVE
ncbi:MAG: DEAD/DEAH box helicase [Dehalococcoidia bacterium]